MTLLCGCLGCVALQAEAGEWAEWYARKLPSYGWAGKFSATERLYLDCHPPVWRLASQARMAQRAVQVPPQTASPLVAAPTVGEPS